MFSRRLTILLVEDDEGHAALIRLNLEDSGLNIPIQHVSDGQAALDYVQQVSGRSDIDSLLILLDLNLPVVDGFRVLQCLKSDHKTRKIPVIILSSSDDSCEIERCYELGCNFYLRKPIAYTDFVHAIQQLGALISVIELPRVDWITRK